MKKAKDIAIGDRVQVKLCAKYSVIGIVSSKVLDMKSGTCRFRIQMKYYSLWSDHYKPHDTIAVLDNEQESKKSS